jgi:mevalonate kinase
MNGTSAKLNGTSRFDERKPSSVTASAFMISASGKVIVFSEPTVLRKKAVMATIIFLKFYLLITIFPTSHQIMLHQFCTRAAEII